MFDVRISLKFVSLLYPMRGLSGKICCKSSVFSIIFQLSLMILEILGFLGLNVVTNTCGDFIFLFLVSSRSFCENLAALL